MVNTYDTIPDVYAINTADVLEDLISALTESAHIFNVEPKLILSFAVEYINTHIDAI